MVLLGFVRFAVNAQGWNYVQPIQPIQPQWNYGWNNFQYQWGDVRMYIPQGYQYYGLQNINGGYFAQFQHNGLWYQKPVQWQMQPNGMRVATITLDVIGATLLNISNHLQWNGGVDYYQYHNAPPCHPYGIPFRRR